MTFYSLFENATGLEPLVGVCRHIYDDGPVNGNGFFPDEDAECLDWLCDSCRRNAFRGKRIMLRLISLTKCRQLVLEECQEWRK